MYVLICKILVVYLLNRDIFWVISWTFLIIDNLIELRRIWLSPWAGLKEGGGSGGGCPRPPLKISSLSNSKSKITKYKPLPDKHTYLLCSNGKKFWMNVYSLISLMIVRPDSLIYDEKERCKEICQLNFK